MNCKNNSINIFIEIFTKIIITINLVAITRFLKIIYHDIFEHLFTISFKKRELFSSVSTYFSIVEINN